VYNYTNLANEHFYCHITTHSGAKPHCATLPCVLQNDEFCKMYDEYSFLTSSKGFKITRKERFCWGI